MCLLSVCIVSNIGRWTEFSAWIVFQVVLLYSEDDMVVMSGDGVSFQFVDVRCLALWSGYLC